MNFAPVFVHDRNLQLAVIAQASIAEVLCHHLAVLDRFNVGREFNSDPVPEGTPSFISKKNFCMANPTSMEAWA